MLISNATVWDGTSDMAMPGMNVLVESNRIKQISAEPIPVNPREDMAILADYDNNIKGVIKDGEIFRNSL